MLIKYFGAGASSSGAVEYVTKNVTAKTLQGNPELTKDLIKNNINKLKYRSGVISFGTDKPSKETVNEIIELFEKSTFAGLDESQYNSLWVEHTDTDNYHIHFVIPRLELSTMKSFNPHYHKQDQKRLLKLQDYINRKYHLINPFEADRRQTLELNTNWTNRNQAKETIDQIVTTAISQEVINSRQELVSFLRDNGLQVKESKNYIAIKSEEDKKHIRLKGAYYNENFTSREELAEELARTEQKHRADTYEQLTSVREELERLIEYKSKRVTKQYEPKIREHRRTDREQPRETSKEDRQIRDTNSRANDLANMDSDNNTSISDTLHTARERIHNRTGRKNISDEEINTTRGEDTQAKTGRRLYGNDIHTHDSRDISKRGQREQLHQDRLEKQKTINELTSIFITQEDTNNDSTRATATRSITDNAEEEQELISNGTTARERVHEQYSRDSKQLQADNEQTATDTHTRVRNYNARTNETKSESIERARNTSETKSSITTAIKSITTSIKEFTNRVIEKLRPQRQEQSRGYGMGMSM